MPLYHKRRTLYTCPVPAVNWRQLSVVFYDVARLSGMLELVDGTHIPIIAPPEDEYAYINRKNFHSINVQGICNAEMIFTDVNAQWPGGHHDSFILNESTIHDNFERGDYGEGWLLGDSGYGLKRWLMTPIATPVTNQQRKYNLSHRKTRCPIERSFGALKSRWRIIDHSGGRLCYLPEKVAKINVTCCVLHNICKRARVPLLHDLDQCPITARPLPRRELFHGTTPPPTRSGLEQRSRIVSTFI